MTAQTQEFNTTPAETEVKVTEKIVKRGKRAVEKKNVVLQRLHVEYVAMDAVKPNPYNPNRQDEHDFELLCRSMQEDGFTQPIIIQQDGTIVDGEHRWRAARTLGFTELPVVRVDMTPEQMRISTLRHNRARGSEDIELTAQVLRDLQTLGAIDWAKDSLMLDDAELDKLLEDIPAPESLAAAEFGNAWVPSNQTSGVDAATTSTDGEREIGSASAEAVDIARKREALLKTVKTEEERAMVMRDTVMVKMHFTFTPEQAEVVRAVLGFQPAVKLYELCRDMPKAG